VTNGHLDLIHRGLSIFDEIVIGVAPNPQKKPLFTIEERLDLIRDAVRDMPNVRLEAFHGLLIDYVRSLEGVAIIRGLRAVSDFEFEFQLALMNRRLDMTIETVFMMPSVEFTFLSSTIVKEVASFGGPVTGLVPPSVERALKQKFGR
jgi:pantetheine-phosphate adenylyltransferase